MTCRAERIGHPLYVALRPVSPKQRRQRRAFGARLRTRRTDVGISQEELAHRAGLHRTYVGSVERGERNVSLDNIQALAGALGVRPADLFLK